MLKAVEDSAWNSFHDSDIEAESEIALSMGDVDYVNAHATSTPLGDLAEIRAIRLALARSALADANNNLRGNLTPPSAVMSPLLVSSTKGATGHLLGAAGAIEAALTVLAVSTNTVPPTRNLDVISEDILQMLHHSYVDNDAVTSESTSNTRSIHLVQHQPISQHIKLAMSNSFGFGGTNVSLLFGKVK